MKKFTTVPTQLNNNDKNKTISCRTRKQYNNQQQEICTIRYSTHDFKSNHDLSLTIKTAIATTITTTTPITTTTITMTTMMVTTATTTTTTTITNITTALKCAQTCPVIMSFFKYSTIAVLNSTSGSQADARYAMPTTPVQTN